MIELKLEEASSLTLNMKLEGDVAGTPQLRFSILSEGMRYTFEATANGNGEFEVQFPVLEGKLAAGTYNAEVEILVDNKHFVPLQETVRLTKEVKPVVKLAEAVKKVQEASVEVKVGVTKKVEPPKVIHDVKGLLEVVSENNIIDTTRMLVGLNSLAARTDGGLFGKDLNVQLDGRGGLTEKEALTALKLLEHHGTDMDRLFALDHLAAVSDNVRGELIDVLRDKGISTSKLKESGLL